MAIGIDLGTTNTVAAIYDEKGNRRIIKIDGGHLFIPSVVSFSQEGVLVGRKAWNNAAMAPKDTIFSIKRLMGRSFDDEEVSAVQNKCPYTIERADESDDQGVRVLINGIKRTPEEISTMILRQVVEDASRTLGEEVNHAVITVPAYFTDVQREATRKAGEQANLIVKKIIDEPTAAAIAFGEEDTGEAHKLLVFDMGGGTLDISIGYLANRKFVGMAIKGNMWLGGDDFDHKIVEMIINWVRETYGVDPSDDKKFMLEARRAAEKAKCVLTEKTEADIAIPGGFTLPGGQPGTVNMTISRREFEAQIRGKVEKSIELVRKVMEERNLKPNDISTVLLVGGSTYIPLVRQRLIEILVSFRLTKQSFEDLQNENLPENILETLKSLENKRFTSEDELLDAVKEQIGEENTEEYKEIILKHAEATRVRDDVNPMEAVALGAAILARDLQGIVCPKCEQLNPSEATECMNCRASLSTAKDGGAVGLHEVTERPLGIGAMHKGDPDVFSVLIEAHTPYPLQEPVQKRYFTTGRKIMIPVYAGDNEKASLNEYQGLIEYKLPEHVPARTPVTVQFNYDRNRILKIRVEVEGYPDLSYEASPRRHVPDPNIIKDEDWRVAIENAIAFANMMLEKYGDFIDQEQKETLEKEKNLARQALTGKDQAAAQENLNKLLQTLDNLGVASRLILTDFLMNEVDPKTSGWLAEQTKNLKNAYKGQDKGQQTLIMKNLDATIKDIFETMPVSPEIRKYGGLLEIRGDSETRSAT